MNRNRTLFWWIFPNFVGMSCLAMVIVVMLGSLKYRELYIQQEISGLQRLLRVLSREMIERINAGTGTVGSLCKEYSRNANVRITIIDMDGRVIADSVEDASLMENHNQRPELISAKEHGVGVACRLSPTFDVMMIYAAQRISIGQNFQLLRVAIPVPDLDSEILATISYQIFVAVFVLVLLGAVIWWMSKRITDPLNTMTYKIVQISRGLRNQDLEIQDFHELTKLSEAINLMQRQTQERIEIIVQKRNQQEAMLMGMKEGVISLDAEGYIITINPMARHMLRCTPMLELKGRDVGDILRSSILLDALAQLRIDGLDIDLEVTLDHLNETIVQVRACRIDSENEQSLTYLVVLNDITHLRRLENMRRDFVANVSHELKTPLTSIRGYAETLGNMKIFTDETALRFLNKIEHNADRLHRIIEDLLILSRIEQSGLPPQDIKAQFPKTILDQLLSDLPEDQRQRISVSSIQTRQKVMVHGPLIHQALFNLVENGIKYSGVDGAVELKVIEQGNWIVFQVIDNGPGIPALHIPLLTQRFYRVDKDRSRAKGGTGLGLSIVKHIVEAHRGELDIVSSVGEGSCFSIRLPINEAQILLTKS